MLEASESALPAGPGTAPEEGLQRAEVSGQPALILPPLVDVCAARWQTLDYLPKEIRRDWTAAFTNSLRRFNAAPSIETLTIVYLASKAVLAMPRRGGKSRQEAVVRLVRARLASFQAGRFQELWEKVQLENKSSRSKAPAKKPDEGTRATFINIPLC